MQDFSNGNHTADTGSVQCIRCHGAPVVDWNLCERCLSTFSRFKRERGGNSRNISVEEFIRQVPLRNTRMRQERSVMAMPSTEPMSGFLVGSQVMEDLLERITKVARSDIPVLIQGDTGTGKELVARAIHIFSQRATKPFVPVNCSTIPNDLAESELFGHERGSFTGAQQKTRGFFNEADQGTIFLDEVHDMLPRIQAKLLRVLESGEVRSVGSAKIGNVDVRLVTAANRNLLALCKLGRFRTDLYFRLAGAVLEVPTLKERREEIPQLVAHLLGQLSTQVFKVDDRVIDVFLGYDWPGNIRELRQVLWQATVFAEGDTIEFGHLPRRITSGVV